MSITTVIDEENVTIVQGINGIMLFKEEWMKKKKQEQTAIISTSVENSMRSSLPYLPATPKTPYASHAHEEDVKKRRHAQKGKDASCVHFYANIA